MIGLGARLRFRPIGLLRGPRSPRAPPGYWGRGDPRQLSFAIEKRAGGHTFQLNFSNWLRDLPGVQVARGASDSSDWYMGFNISRKFF